MVVPEDPPHHFTLLVRILAAEFAGLLGDIHLHHAGLGERRIAVDQHRHLAHDIDLAKVVGPGLAAEEIDENRLPFEAAEFQRQSRLVGVTAFAHAIEFDRHAFPPK